MTAAPPKVAFLQRAGLLAPGEIGVWTALGGGVSSDIWHVSGSRGEACVKQALPQLKVAANWLAPISRNTTEWHYLEVVGRIVPTGAPRLYAHDPDLGIFAMEWLGPTQHTLWKQELMAGRIDLEFAGEVGHLLGTIHAATAGSVELQEQFCTEGTFRALRIEPYIETCAKIHPDLQPILGKVARTTLATRKVLVHGDISPKNILMGQSGAVFLDAECGWYGDPAFDLAFCLTHLILKARWNTEARGRLEAAIEHCIASYFTHVHWEPVSHVDRRAATLLPTLALARVDGKSPVEYLGPDQRSALRARARFALLNRPAGLADAINLLLVN